MKFEIKLNKEQFKEIGKGVGKIGKAILIEGTIAVASNSVMAVVTKTLHDGPSGVKEMGLDDFINKKKKKKSKKKELKIKKDATEESSVVEVEVITDDVDDITK